MEWKRNDKKTHKSESEAQVKCEKERKKSIKKSRVLRSSNGPITWITEQHESDSGHDSSSPQFHKPNLTTHDWNQTLQPTNQIEPYNPQITLNLPTHNNKIEPSTLLPKNLNLTIQSSNQTKPILRYFYVVVLKAYLADVMWRCPSQNTIFVSNTSRATGEVRKGER